METVVYLVVTAVVTVAPSSSPAATSRVAPAGADSRPHARRVRARLRSVARGRGSVRGTSRDGRCRVRRAPSQAPIETTGGRGRPRPSSSTRRHGGERLPAGDGRPDCATPPTGTVPRSRDRPTLDFRPGRHPHRGRILVERHVQVGRRCRGELPISARRRGSRRLRGALFRATRAASRHGGAR